MTSTTKHQGFLEYLLTEMGICSQVQLGETCHCNPNFMRNSKKYTIKNTTRKHPTL